MVPCLGPPLERVWWDSSSHCQSLPLLVLDLSFETEEVVNEVMKVNEVNEVNEVSEVNEVYEVRKQAEWGRGRRRPDEVMSRKSAHLR